MPPVIATVSFLVGGAGFGTVTSIFGFAAGSFGFAVAQFGLRLAGSLLLSAAARALGPSAPGSPELVREVQQPNSLPPYRFVYGNARIYGSPVLRVKGPILFGCYILNSRPSQAFTKLFFDKREVIYSGDPTNFGGIGGRGTITPFLDHVDFWVGLGNQTSPPDAIVAESAGLFLPSDGFTGMTVLWYRLSAGPNDQRADRWPRTPPEMEVEGLWSRVWDPRDPAQSETDPSTWVYSDNQALCALDALMQNPVRQYRPENLLVNTFAEAADIADEDVPLKAGGTEKRYRINGTLIFNGAEILDLVQPMFAAGGADPVRVGGRLGIAPGAYTAPIYTADDVLEEGGLAFQTLRPGRDLATTVRCTYTSPDRDWRSASLQDYTVPGAQASDGGVLTYLDLQLSLVTSPTQAMRLQKMTALRQRRQKTVTTVLPPDAFQIVSGSNITVGFPAPYAAINGEYRVVSASPCVFASDVDGGVAMRIPVELNEVAASDWAWNPATDEQDVEQSTFDPTRELLAPGGAISIITGPTAALDTGGVILPRIRFAFDPSPNTGVITYEWDYAVGAGSYQAGGFIDAEIRDGSGDVFGFVQPVTVGESYSIRVRALSSTRTSIYVTITGVIALGPDVTIAAPTPLTATPSAGQIIVTFRSPNNPDFQAVEIYGSNTNNSALAVLLSGPTYGAPNAVFSHTETGLGAAVTRYYFAKSRGPFGYLSPFSAVISATTP